MEIHDVERRLMESKVEAWLLKGLGRVPSDFFEIPSLTQGGIRRERAFCYEWYHQCSLLTQVMEIPSYLRLHGELDKRGYSSRVREICPDFLVHEPGTGRFNIAVIEVKTSLKDVAGVVKDYESIVALMNALEYQSGYLVFINCTSEKVKSLIRRHLSDCGLGQPIHLRIQVVIKSSPTDQAEILSLSEILTQDQTP